MKDTPFGKTVVDSKYSELNNVFWKETYSTQAQDSVYVRDKGVWLEPNFANNTYGITEVRHITWRPHYAWTNRTFQAIQ